MEGDVSSCCGKISDTKPTRAGRAHFDLQLEGVRESIVVTGAAGHTPMFMMDLQEELESDLEVGLGYKTSKLGPRDLQRLYLPKG